MKGISFDQWMKGLGKSDDFDVHINVLQNPTSQTPKSKISLGRTHRLKSQVLEKVSPRDLKSTKLGPKILQAGNQNPLKSLPWGVLERSGAILAHLGLSLLILAHLGPKRQKNVQKTIRGTSLGPPSWEAKSTTNRQKMKCKYHF